MAIRIRPLNYKEALITPVQIIERVDDKTISLLRNNDKSEESEDKYYFSFDYIFDESIDQVHSH